MWPSRVWFISMCFLKMILAIFGLTSMLNSSWAAFAIYKRNLFPKLHCLQVLEYWLFSFRHVVIWKWNRICCATSLYLPCDGSFYPQKCNLHWDVLYWCSTQVNITTQALELNERSIWQYCEPFFVATYCLLLQEYNTILANNCSFDRMDRAHFI